MKFFNIRIFFSKLSVSQTLLLGFFLMDLTGTILLALPISSSDNQPQPLIDAFFTATSAVSTTGLIVVDTGSYYSLFGQIVILIIIQISGMGYMTVIVWLVYILGMKMSLKSGMTLQESLPGIHMINIKKFISRVIIFSFLFELFIAFLLMLCWLDDLTLSQAVYLGIFHSISAFCTAGFSLFSTSFESYKNDLFINSIIAFASIAGAIGFFVIYNLTRYIKSKLFLKKRRKNKRKIFLSLHTKMVLILSFTLVFSGIFIIFFAENRTSTLPKTSQIVYAAFQTISASTTTGFNSVNIGSMSDTSLFFIIILMFIGASPGGTGGGIKSTTFGIMLLAMIAFLKGRKDTNIFWRRIPPETTTKAFGLAIIAVIVVLIDGLILSYTEKESFIKIVFEIVSALATTGLSAGITPDLSTPGKLVICITMIIGRLGPLTIGFLLVGKTRPINLKYPAEEVFIG